MRIATNPISWCALLALAAGWVCADVAPPLSMDDQHGKTRALSFPRAKVSVLLMADRKGSSGLEPWVTALYERYTDTVAIEGVALLRGVPRPLRGLVRHLFRRGVPYPVMLDWTNESASLYSYDPGKPNVYVIAPDGRIHLRINGSSDEANLARCFTGIDETF